VAALDEAFGREHERTYGHRAGAEEPVELVNIKVVGRGVPDTPRMPSKVYAAEHHEVPPPPPRRAYFGPELGWLEAPVLPRAALATPRQGPCIVEEYDATCVVPPGATAALDGYGNIVMELG
jgi:N-methylhydantoinase A